MMNVLESLVLTCARNKHQNYLKSIVPYASHYLNKLLFQPWMHRQNCINLHFYAEHPSVSFFIKLSLDVVRRISLA